MLSNDPDGQIGCYADHLERYFLRTDADRDFVMKDLRAHQERGDIVQSLTLDKVSINMESDAVADLSFMENVSNVHNGLSKTITVRTILKFMKKDGEWKIFYERQLDA